MLKRGCLACAVLLFSWIPFLMCCGCQAGPSEQKQLSAADLIISLHTETVIRMDGQEYRGTVQYDPSQIASITLESPEELRGLTCFWQGDHFKMTYQGLAVQANECPLFDSSFAVLLMRVLNYAQKSASLTASGNNTFQGIQDGVPFTITAGPDGSIQTIEIPRFDFVAEFSVPQSGTV